MHTRVGVRVAALAFPPYLRHDELVSADCASTMCSSRVSFLLCVRLECSSVRASRVSFLLCVRLGCSSECASRLFSLVSLWSPDVCCEVLKSICVL